MPEEGSIAFETDSPASFENVFWRGRHQVGNTDVKVDPRFPRVLKRQNFGMLQILDYLQVQKFFEFICQSTSRTRHIYSKTCGTERRSG